MVAAHAFDAVDVVLVVEFADQVDAREVLGPRGAPALLGDADQVLAVEQLGVLGQRRRDRVIDALRQQARGDLRHGHRVGLRRVAEDLDVAGDRIGELAFESDPALARDRQPGLGFQHVERDARAAQDALVFQVELGLDDLFVLAGEIDQAAVAQHVDVRRDAFEDHVLRGVVEPDFRARLVQLGGVVIGAGPKAVEQVLGDGERAPGARGAEVLGVRSGRAPGRAVGRFVAVVAVDLDLREVAGERPVDALLGRRNLVAQALELGVVAQEIRDLILERQGRCLRARQREHRHRGHHAKPQSAMRHGTPHDQPPRGRAGPRTGRV